MPTKLTDLNKTVQKSMKPILKKLSNFSTINNIPKSVINSNVNKIYKRIYDSQNQSKEIERIKKAIQQNMNTAKTINELISTERRQPQFEPKINTQILEDIDAESKIYTEPKKHKQKSKGKEPIKEDILADEMKRLTLEEPTYTRAHARLIEPTLGQMKLVVPESHQAVEYMTPSEKMMDELFDQYHNPSTSQMDVDEMKHAIEPTQMEHINKISELLKREPKLKNEIKNIIVNQFVKAKIKPEQYEAIKQNIDALEVPEATHKAKKAKPRGKKSKLDNNVNKVIEEIVKESIPKPRGKKSKTIIKSTMNVDASPITDEKLIKPVKETYKQKKKVIRLD